MKTYLAPYAQDAVTVKSVATTAATVADTTPTNAVLLYTADPVKDGAIVSKLSAMPMATVTATALYLYISKDNGATISIKDSELMSAYTLTATSKTPKTTFADITQDNPIRLQAGDKLFVGIGVALATGIVFNAELMEF